MEALDLTKFPCLEEVFEPENTRLTEIRFPISLTSEDALCRAWASMLMSYTGAENVKFLFNDECIEVNERDWIVKRTSYIEDIHRSTQSTRISLRSTGTAQRFALELIHHGKGLSLQSFGHVPQHHLDEISKEIEVLSDWFSQNESTMIPASHLASLQKSILNCQPTVLKGPDRLYELVNFNSDKTALSWCDENGSQKNCTYQDLHDKVESLARLLSQVLGVYGRSTQPVIAIILPQCPVLYIAQLAILKLGCAFCPINLETPQERIRFILNDVNAAIVVTIEEQRVKLDFGKGKIPIFVIDDMMDFKSTDSSISCHPCFHVSPDDAAYIMYTSGSTGFPKGVPISHIAVTQSLLAHDKHIPSYTRFLQFAAPTFDVSIFEIFFTFFREATLVCGERTTLLNDLPGFVNRMEIDAMELTPSVASSLIRSRSAVPQLRLLLTIGEMLTESVVTEFGGRDVTESILWAMYGPTEAAIHCTLQCNFDSRFRVNNIGWPLETVSAFILEFQDGETCLEEINENQICAIGHVGELVVGGIQLTKCYLNRPDQTAAAFIPKSPWGPLYRTGDKARMLPNGSLECLGRVSSGQVKLRGQRLELGEVEKTALKSPSCINAVAEVIDGVLVLFCHFEKGQSSHEVIECCKLWLPAYMVPGEFVFLKDFPLLASGKIDRKWLREQYLQNQDTLETLEAGDKESIEVISLVEKLLGHSVALDATVSAAGIDSLMTIRLVALLRSADFQISALNLLKCSTVRDICRRVKKQPSSLTDLPTMKVEDLDLGKFRIKDIVGEDQIQNVESVSRCTPTQIAMVAETLRNNYMYWNSITLKVSYSTPETVASCIRKIIAANEILRSGFLESDATEDPVVQILWKVLPDYVVEIVENLKLTPNVTEDSDLLRPVKVRICSSGNDVKVLLHLHHAIYDGWSMDIFCADLSSLAKGESLRSRVQFSVIQQYYSNKTFDNERTFWLRHLDEAHPTALGNYPTNRTYNDSASVSFSLGVESEHARNLAVKLQISTQVLFQAALFVTLSQMTGLSDLLIAMVTSGRAIPIPGIESTMGPCLNTLPVRVDVSHAELVTDLIMNIQRLNREILQNSQIALRDIKKALGIGPTVHLSDVLFIWQESLHHLEDIEKVQILESNDNVEFGLIVEVQPTSGETVGKMSYHKECFSEEQVSEILSRFRSNLVQYIALLDSDLDEPLDLRTHASPSRKQIIATAQPASGCDSKENDWSYAERKIASAVSQIVTLPVECMQKTTSLFKYGIDSISSIRLARTLRDQGFGTASVAMILGNPSIEQLTKAINAEGCVPSKSWTESDLIPEPAIKEIKNYLEHNDIEADVILPCTPLQEAMLSSSFGQVASGYITRIVFRIHGNVDRIRNSWVDTLEKHQIFKTCFVQTERKELPFVQVVRKLSNFPSVEVVEYDEFRNRNSAMRKISHLLETHKPPILVRTSSSTEGCLLDLTCHHAMYDAMAIQYCINEIESLYCGLKPTQSTRPNTFIRKVIGSQSGKNLKFWGHTLKGFQPLVVHLNSSMGTTNILSHQACLSVSIRAIDDACKLYRCTMSSLIQSALAKSMFFLTSITDICYGNVVGNRDESTENLVFPTFNTVPMRVNLDNYLNNRNLVDFIQQQSLESNTHNLVSLRKIQHSLRLFDTRLFFALLIFQAGPYRLDPKIWEIESETGTIDFPLVIEIIPDRSNDTLILSLQYNEGIFAGSNTPFSDFQALIQLSIQSLLLFPEGSSKRISYDVPTLSLNTRKSEQDLTMNDNVLQSHGQLTKNQELVCSAISSIRDIPEDQIHTNRTIFHYGIDSIAAIQLATKLKTETDRLITPAQIQQNPVINEIAKCLENAPKSDQSYNGFDFGIFDETIRTEISNELRQISPNARFRPCTPSQIGLLSQFLRSQSLYVNYLVFDFEVQSTTSGLKESVSQVVAHHEILRTGFVPVSQLGFEFAMITYPSLNLNEKVQVVGPDKFAQMDRNQWRQQATIEFRENIHEPPWKMILERHENGFAMHLIIFHAIYDAHSLRLLLKDLTHVLSRRALETRIGLDTVLNSIVSRSSIQSQQNEKLKSQEFWKYQFSESVLGADTAASTSFPNLSPLRTFIGRKEIQSLICLKTLQTLESNCHSQGFTLQAAGQAAFAEILSAYVGEPVVTFGVVLSGRDAIPGGQDCAFPCMTTVPFPIKIETNRRELVNKISKFNAKVRDHQFSSMVDISKWIGHTNERLFDTIFAFQKFPSFSYSVPVRLREEYATDEYILAFEMEPCEDGLKLQATFDVDRIPVAQAKIMLQQFETILTEIAISVESSERTFSASIYSMSPAVSPILDSPVMLLHEFVEKTASHSPDLPAFKFVDNITPKATSIRSWTYRELDDHGNKVASLLRQSGVAHSELVGICFEKCPEASFAILGILKAGCAYVALDPQAPLSRKQYIMDETKAGVVLTANRGASYFSAEDEHKLGSATIIYLDEVDLDSISIFHQAIKIQPHSLCYCLYTSGTTGNPKGCRITHENAVQAMRAFSLLFSGRWDESSRWLQFASFHFDVSVLELFWSWSEGICVISAPRDLLLSDLQEFIRRLEVTHIDLTPSLATLLTPEDVPSLCKGIFITGGEALRQDILDKWGETRVIHNGYGPTEATIGVTMYPQVPPNGKPSNIGWQFKNVSTYVFYANSTTPVLRGAVGELCVAGKLVGDGYLNDPVLTKSKFGILESGERFYRTGDHVRLLHDGSFEFLGRTDEQVKLRGQRLEIDEINSVIKEIPGLRNISTLVLRHPDQTSKQIVSFVVSNAVSSSEDLSLEQGPEISKLVGQIRKSCRDNLPPYMIPTFILPINKLPLTTNNKVAGKVLRTFFNSLTMSQLHQYDAEESERLVLNSNETKIVKVIAERFGVPFNSILPHSNVFQFIDSISVIGFTRELIKVGFTTARVATVLKNDTVESLAQALSIGHTNADQGSVLSAKQRISACFHRYYRYAAQVLEIDAQRIEAIAPCTPLQEAMVSNSLTEGKSSYFSSFTRLIEMDMDLERLKSSWTTVYNRTDILRTKFVATGKGHIQIRVTDTLPWFDLMETHDVTEAINTSRERWILKNQKSILQPLQFNLYENSGSKERTMVLNIFHGLYDGIGLPLILEYVNAEYEGKYWSPSFQFHSILPFGPLCYESGASDFWSSRLVPPWGRIGQNSSFQAGIVSSTAEFQQIDLFEQKRKEFGLTHQAIIQTCWSVVLQNLCSAKVLLGLVVSGRSINIDVEHTIGPLFNTILYQSEIHPQITWVSAIKSAQKFNADAVPYQHTSLRDIIQYAERAHGIRPRLDNLFVFQLHSRMSRDFVEMDYWAHESLNSDPIYPLALEAECFQDCLKLHLVADTGYMDKEATNRTLNELLEKIEEFLKDPNSTINLSSNQPQKNPQLIKNDYTQPKLSESNFSWTETANLIREEIAEIASIDVEQISEDISIFSLGCDSIDAIKLVGRLNKRGFKINLSTIMIHPSIASLLSYVDNCSTNGATNSTSDGVGDDMLDLPSMIDSRIKSKSRPATPIQESMYSGMIHSDYHHYFNHDVLKLKPETDLTRLKDAWERCISENEILRTTFHVSDDIFSQTTYIQIVNDMKQVQWMNFHVEGDDEIPRVLETIREHVQTLPDIEPQLVLSLLFVTNEPHLVLSLPHAMYDGWSLGLLHSDVWKSYYGYSKDRPSVDLAVKKILQGKEAGSARYWKDYLFGSKRCLIQTSEYLDSQSSQIVHRKELQSRTSISDIQYFCRQESITMHVLTQACWSLVLAYHCQQLEVSYGVVLSGRDTVEMQDVLFPTMNTVAFRSILHGNFKNLIQDIQHDLSGILEHQHFPLSKALISSDIQKLFDSLFLFQYNPPDISEMEANPLYESIMTSSNLDYPVCIEAQVIPTALVWRAACHGETMSEIETEALLTQLDDTLLHVIEKPETDIIHSEEASLGIGCLPFFDGANLLETPRAIQEPVKDDLLSERDLKIEQIISQVLATVSGNPWKEISSNVSIFAYGLDSISAIKFSHQLRKRDIQLSVETILQNPTVIQLAKEARKSSNPKMISQEFPETLDIGSLATVLKQASLEPYQVESVLPATAGQILFLTTWNKTRGEKFLANFTFDLDGAFTLDQCQLAWLTVIRNNAILRTVFIRSSDSKRPIFQVVLKNSQVIHNVNSVSKQQDELQIQPLVVASINSTKESSNYTTLNLRIHHALYDAVSLPHLVEAYKFALGNADSKGTNDDTVLRNLAFRGYLDEHVRRAKAFWSSYLSDLTGNHQWTQIAESEIRNVIFIPSAIQLPREKRSNWLSNYSLQAFALACYSIALAKQYSQKFEDYASNDIVIGVYLANRSFDTSIHTWPTVNVVPVRIRNPLHNHVEVIAAQVQQDLIEVSKIDHACSSWDQIHEWTGLKIWGTFNFLVTTDEALISDALNGKREYSYDDEKFLRPGSQLLQQFRVDKTWIVPEELRGLLNEDVYLNTMDVELAIREGAIDIGFWGPLESQDFHKLVKDMKTLFD